MIRYLFTGTILLLLIASAAIAQNENQAAIVISLGDEGTITRCVDFSEEQITGYELLSRAELSVDIEVVGLGTTVCRIEGTGCPANDCFCQCKGGGPCEYWSYWHLKGDEWSYSQAGASVVQVKDGDVQGWVWGAGSPNEAVPPPLLSFEEVCSPQPAPGRDEAVSGVSSSEVMLESTGASDAEFGSETGAQVSAPTPRNTAPYFLGQWAVPVGVVILAAAVGAILLRRRRRAK